MKIFFILPVFLIACAKPPTWGDFMRNQSITYTGEDGNTHYSIWCENPAVCMHIAGMRCPNGYNKENYHTNNTHGWAFAVGGGSAMGGTYDNTQTRMTIECKSLEVVHTTKPTTKKCIQHYQGDDLPLTTCPLE